MCVGSRRSSDMVGGLALVMWARGYRILGDRSVKALGLSALVVVVLPSGAPCDDSAAAAFPARLASEPTSSFARAEAGGSKDGGARLFVC